MKLFFKKLIAPHTNLTRTLDSLQTWEVSWKSRSGMFSMDWKPETEVFITEAEATYFKISLESAFKLLRFTGAEGIKVTLKKTE